LPFGGAFSFPPYYTIFFFPRQGLSEK